MEGDEIVVTGTRYYVSNQFAWDWGFGGGGYGGGGYGGGGGDSYGGGGYSAGGGPTEPPPPPDEAQIEIIVAIPRPLDAREQRAVDNLKIQISKQTEAINNLADNSQIRLKDGSIVTGAELKQIWSKTDFVINENGTTYANGTDRGQADYANGNAQVSFNIETLAKYDAQTGGMAYVIAHELGHMTAAGRASNSAFSDGSISNDANEQFANDIARAIVNLEGDPVMARPGSGYSAEAEQHFSTPTAAGTETSYDPGYGGNEYAGGGYYDQQPGHHYPYLYEENVPYQYV